MTSASGDFDLTLDELRAVALFAVTHAQTVLVDFEAEAPDDPRPREALDAARAFASGAPRTNLQRVTAVAAHRAAKSAPTEIARLAALACGDAAASAYLHPIAKATQLGHILRAASCAALVAELQAGGDAAAGSHAVSAIAAQAVFPLPDVLRRYPVATSGASRLSQLMSELDTAIRGRP
jgi:hypothetical protein